MFFRSTISFGFMRVEKEPIMNNLKKNNRKFSET